MNLGSGLLDISGAVSTVGSASMLFDLDTPATSDKVTLTNANSGLKIGSGLLDASDSLLEFDDFVFTPTVNFGPGTYTLFDTSKPITGNLGSNLTGPIGAFSGTLSLGDGGNDVVLTVTSVPEPTTCCMLALGGLMALACRRGKRRAA
jgi:hypothetical protein